MRIRSASLAASFALFLAACATTDPEVDAARQTWRGASYEDVVATARGVLTEDNVLDGVPELIGTVKIECLFGDGMRILHVEHPIAPGGRR